MRLLDPIVIVLYLVAVAAVGLALRGRQRDATDYFVGARDLPWWAVCLSIVATETSTLTVISVPGIAYGGRFVFVGLAVGYLIGRILVAFVLLPLYLRGDMVSAYQYLGLRFGPRLQAFASLAFLVTRLLAEGVRLFASAIPIALLLGSLGVSASYSEIILALTAVTVLYTWVGGIRSVIWTDAVQLALYVGGAVLCVLVLLGLDGAGAFARIAQAGKFGLFTSGSPLTDPFSPLGAVVGGALFTMASHGADQLIVQRLLSCRSLAAGQRAVIGSAVVVMGLFALFSLLGALLWVHLGGASPASLGLASTDGLYPRFILRDLPPGLSGLLIAGILAATMGSLSSALNSLSNSTVADLLRELGGGPGLSRWLTILWAVVMAGFASMFTSTKSSVIVLGLGITGYTYGALLGAFLLGRAVRGASERDAMVAFAATLAVMALVVLELRIGGRPLAFTWFVPLGAAISLAVGGALAAGRRPRGNA